MNDDAKPPKPLSGAPIEKTPASDPVVAPANPSGLPDEIPERWLLRLREGQVKDRWVTILLGLAGSSVLSTIIGIGASYLVERYKANLNRENEIARLELEYKKKYEAEQANINLQYKKLSIDERRRAFEQLASQFHAFENELDLYIGICKRASEHPQLDYSDPAKESMTALLDQIAKTNDAARNSQIAKEQVSKSVQEITGAVNINLEKVVNSPHVNPSLIEQHEELKKKIDLTKTAIETQKQSVSLSP